jgi:hypothetical protein
MIEIAISIGVIGFALVAIIGILPAGLNVQKGAGEDTTISQDAPFFMESIRNGGTNTPFNSQTNFLTGLNFLTNYVESITIASFNNNAWTTNLYTNVSGTAYSLVNGRIILGLLSTPEFYPNQEVNGGWVPGPVTNIVTARVRALSGSAIEQNGANSITAFRYLMNVEIAPFSSFAPDSINYAAYGGGALGTNDPNYVIRFNRWRAAEVMQFNLFELRLRFSWPVLPNGNAGPNHQSYRTLIAGHLLSVPNAGFANPLNFFQPQWYFNTP